MRQSLERKHIQSLFCSLSVHFERDEAFMKATWRTFWRILSWRTNFFTWRTLNQYPTINQYLTYTWEFILNLEIIISSRSLINICIIPMAVSANRLDSIIASGSNTKCITDPIPNIDPNQQFEKIPSPVWACFSCEIFVWLVSHFCL